MDFTLETYKILIIILQEQDYTFFTFSDYFKIPYGKRIVLRHDVDKRPENSLVSARLEAGKGIIGTYYFRTNQESFDEKIIKKIYELGHEIGYHYEDVSLMAERQKAEGRRREEENEEDYEKHLVELAIKSFEENLAKLREIVPVKTICMHGSPMSKWDSRLLWKYYDYHDFGIIGEPYFDIDFNEVLYLTDTGRCWDGDQFNIRDKATVPPSLSLSVPQSLSLSVSQSLSPSVSQSPLKFHSTFDIIRAAEEGKLPDKIMMTFHPQRWTDKPVPWMRELIWQNTKNVGKFFLKKVRSR